MKVISQHIFAISTECKDLCGWRNSLIKSFRNLVNINLVEANVSRLVTHNCVCSKVRTSGALFVVVVSLLSLKNLRLRVKEICHNILNTGENPCVVFSYENTEQQ